MKKILLCFSLILLTRFCVNAQNISNIDYWQEGNDVVVGYEVDAPVQEVQLYVSYDGGKTFGAALKKVTGDVRNVSAGEHKITWKVLEEVEKLVGDNIVFRISCNSGYVDLGLSVKWATCNLGASKPEEYGGYYQWGGTYDVTSTSIYLDWNKCPYHKGSRDDSGWTKYIPSNKSSYWSGPGSPDNKVVLDPEDDVAHVKLGGSWRMPTIEEWDELRNTSNCSWTWTTINGIKGYKVQSRKTGFTNNWIFLPAAGTRYGDYLSDAGSRGRYWSSSLYTDNPRSAYYLYFLSAYVYTSGTYRCGGQSVRPVSE